MCMDGNLKDLNYCLKITGILLTVSCSILSVFSGVSSLYRISYSQFSNKYVLRQEYTIFFCTSSKSYEESDKRIRQSQIKTIWRAYLKALKLLDLIIDRRNTVVKDREEILGKPSGLEVL